MTQANTTTAKPDTILEVRDLCVHFDVGGGGFLQGPKKIVRAVDGVSFSLRRGETLGLVGESGCGKSTLGRALMQLVPPTSGSVVLHEKSGSVDLVKLSGKALQPYRQRLQMIFQDPYASLNPRMTVGDIIAEPISVHRLVDGREALEKRVRELMEMCGLNPRFIRRYPHEFSGGQRQRIGIARALASNPSLIVADEPISALDVSIQAQILNLLASLQKELGLTMIFIAHDLAAVRHISDRIAVMYLGKIAEVSPSRELYSDPFHPYTQALISAVPVPDPVVEATRQRIELKGELPSPLNPPTGCRFHTRCPWAWDVCKRDVPKLVAVPGAAETHITACHFATNTDRDPRKRPVANESVPA